MVIKSKYKLLILILLSFSFLGIAQQQKIKQKKEELSEIKKEILSLEIQYKQKTSKEKKSYASFQNINRQNFLLNKLIINLKKQENDKEIQIILTKREISDLKAEIKLLRENYTKYIISIYKYGEQNEWSIFLDLSSMQKLFLRYKYLKEFSKRREQDLSKLKSSKEELEKLNLRLEVEKKEKQLLVKEKQQEEKDLSAKLRESKSLLNTIRKDKNELKKEIKAKIDAKEKIAGLISKLIEAEKKREEERLARLKNNKTKTKVTQPEEIDYDIDLTTTDFSSFSTLKGRMRWPINRGTIFKKFGQNRNEKLKTVTVNHGIDIKVNSSLEVKSVAEGVVSAIDWIPGYGSVVIVSHKGDFRTVYSHIEEIFVSEGDKLEFNSGIGKVGESLEGFILHFEIWKSRDNQNPEIWLAKK
ncbi:MAG: hypothetical protein CO128_07910 [Ignavibacteriales bacterium CG_4_9_14_3_um_filter_30_11]|nr:MAG: hypothetical protein CO128_07910 [Ignavibacteriales bacterium CG_4_9_14_3_um_filter_30_11]